MPKFTTDNSAFTSEECDVINEAYDRLLPQWQTDDGNGEKNLSDRLNNAWQEGNTADQLVARVNA